MASLIAWAFGIVQHYALMNACNFAVKFSFFRGVPAGNLSLEMDEYTGYCAVQQKDESYRIRF